MIDEGNDEDTVFGTDNGETILGTCLQTTSSSSNVTLNDQSTGCNGLHTFYHVADATDIPRALDALFVRLWLAGFTGYKIKANGAFKPTSHVDLALRVPSQPIYVRAHVTEPVRQDKEVHLRPSASAAEILDTRTAIPDITHNERTRYDALVAEVREGASAECAAVKETYPKSM